jgi:hypothetical protein
VGAGHVPGFIQHVDVAEQCNKVTSPLYLSSEGYNYRYTKLIDCMIHEYSTACIIDNPSRSIERMNLIS